MMSTTTALDHVAGAKCLACQGASLLRLVDKFLRLRDFTDMFRLPVYRPSPLLVAREAAGKYLSAVFLSGVFRLSEDRPRLSPAAREEEMFRWLADKF